MGCIWWCVHWCLDHCRRFPRCNWQRNWHLACSDHHLSIFRDRLQGEGARKRDVLITMELSWQRQSFERSSYEDFALVMNTYFKLASKAAAMSATSTLQWLWCDGIVQMRLRVSFSFNFHSK